MKKEINKYFQSDLIS